ncbi:hypothetical protein MFLO_14277 [Listeria floridensis FSL S10-1187]|uniref:Bacterial Ig domain-containing protein n=1 Tax=Listeria floridensis FSL S10-1187 TaxID=1265817 RepID=A0ABP3AUE7_9LIST|nr:immunoglobulin-like domain-containing protein [Listeria floridensis]EUJ26128.1 hypothetical protein MFLO_14277 [Listeria floridensis FSL S10-1187]
MKSIRAIKKVSGTGIADDTIIVTFPDGTTAQTTVNADGKWSLDVPSGVILKKDQFVYAQQTNGLTDSIRVRTKIQEDLRVPDAPAVNTIKAGDTQVTGKAEPGNDVTVTLPNGSKVTGKADSNGDFTIKIPAQQEGQKIDVTQTGTNGKESTPKTVTVGSNHKPVITANDKTLQIGDTFNPLDGVTATDSEDGNLTSQIKVVSNDVNTNLAGTYHVTYSVTDKDGNVVTKTIQVTVESLNGSIAVNTFYLGYDNWLNGSFTGDITKVNLMVNGKSYQMVNVKDGVFQYYAKDKILALTDDAKMIGYSSNGKVLQTVKVNIVDGSVLKGTVKADPFVVGMDAYVKGSYTGAVSKIGIFVNGKEYGRVPVGSNGSLQYYAKDKIKAKTDKVELVGYNSEGKEISRVQVPLTDASDMKGNLTPAEYSLADDSFVSGTFTGSIKTIALQVNGKAYAPVNVADSSHFQYYAKDKIKSVSDDVKVLGYNAAGALADTKSVKIVASHEGGGSITPNEYYMANDSFVTGTVVGNVKQVALEVNGTKYMSVNVTDATHFQYYAKDKIKNTTDVVKVYAYDGAGNLVDTKTVKVSASHTELGKITPSDFTIGKDGFVKGIYVGDVKTIALEVNGKIYTAVNVVNDSQFQYYAKDKIKAASDDVKVLAYSSTGQLVDTKVVVIVTGEKESSKIETVNNFVIGTDGFIKGTYSGNAKQISIKVNGTSYSPVNVGVNNTFQYYAKDKISKATDQVSVLLFDEKGALLSEKAVPLKAAGQDETGSISVNVYTVGKDSWISGIYAGKVAKVALKVNGKEYMAVAVQAGGNFKYYAKDKITSNTDRVEVVAYTASNQSVDTKGVTIK